MSESSSTFEYNHNSPNAMSSASQTGLIENLTSDLHRLNQTIMNAVEAGVSVELVRTSRHHCGNGNWGDLMSPVINKG